MRPTTGSCSFSDRNTRRLGRIRSVAQRRIIPVAFQDVGRPQSDYRHCDDSDTWLKNLGAPPVYHFARARVGRWHSTSSSVFAKEYTRTSCKACVDENFVVCPIRRRSRSLIVGKRRDTRRKYRNNKWWICQVERKIHSGRRSEGFAINKLGWRRSPRRSEANGREGVSSRAWHGTAASEGRPSTSGPVGLKTPWPSTVGTR